MVGGYKINVQKSIAYVYTCKNNPKVKLREQLHSQ